MRAPGLGILLAFALVGSPACGGGSGGGGSATDGVTVTGTVLDVHGQGVPVIPVALEGRSPVLTDEAGRFRLEDVSVPYTLILVRELGQRAEVFVGLTRLDPILRADGGPGVHGASLEGTTTGGTGFPEPPDHSTAISVLTEGSDLDVHGVVPTSGNWSIPDLRWNGAATTRVQFLAMQVHVDAAGVVDHFTGLATPEFTVADGEVRSGLNVDLTAVDTVLCSGTVNTPPGYTIAAKVVYLLHTSGALMPLPPDTTSSNTFSLATVGTPDVSTTLLFSFGTPQGGNLIVLRGVVAAPVSGLSIDVPSAPVLVSPNDGAVGALHETVFVTSPDAQGVHVFSWTPQGTGPAIEVHTNASTVTPPDLTPYGLPVPHGEMYTWRCMVAGPDVTVDHHAAGRGTGPLERTSGFIHYTSSRPFQTTP